MPRDRWLVSLIWILVAACGCTPNYKAYISPKMHRLGADATPPPLRREQAMVIFMRPAHDGYEYQSSVFALRPDNDQLIGIVSSESKIAYPTEPGEHMFMVIGENADFLRANLKPGKTYYVAVIPRFGWVKARFSLQPLRQADLTSAEFVTANNSCEFVENTDQSRQWAQDNWPSIQDKKVDYMRKWQAKPQAERNEQTLNPEDGR